MVTAKGVGTASITATARYGSKKKAKCKITVTIPVKGVKLNKTSAKVYKGKTLQLTAKISPKNATNKKVTWKSSKPKVASVTQKGKVKALKKGKTTITVTTKDGKKTAKCKITVTAGKKSKKIKDKETQ